MQSGFMTVVARDEKGNEWQTEIDCELEFVELKNLRQSVSPQTAMPAIVVIYANTVYPIQSDQA